MIGKLEKWWIEIMTLKDRINDLEKEVEKISSDFQMFQKILQDMRESLEDKISAIKDEYGLRK